MIALLSIILGCRVLSNISEVQQGLECQLVCSAIASSRPSQPETSSLKCLIAVAISSLGCIRLSFYALPFIFFVKLAMITLTSKY